MILFMRESQAHSEDRVPVAPPYAGLHPVVNVVVAGGDAVVGRTLGLLLESPEYRVDFVAGAHVGWPRALEGADLLVLAPGLTEEQEDAVVSTSYAGAPGDARVPVLHLVPNLREASSSGGNLSVPWPCRAEEMERQIRVVLGRVPEAQAEGGGVSGR